MEYVIIEIQRTIVEPDGLVIMVKANPVVDTMPELTKMFGRRYVRFSMNECDETENFIFPFSEDLAQNFVQIARDSQNQESFWKPNEDDFVDDTVHDTNGNMLKVNRSMDLIPEISLDDIEDDWIEDWDDEEDEDWDEDDDFEYSEDLFDVDPLDSVDDNNFENGGNGTSENIEDMFNDFYSEEPLDSSYRTKRFSSDEIKKMSVHERHEECGKCSKAKNLYGLIDFYTYFFTNGCQATNEYYCPAMAFLYARAKDVDTLNSILQKYSFCLFSMSEDSREVSTQLVEIGVTYPYLSNSQIDYLEELYNNPKYCEVMDEILFDKEKLPRVISGITKDDLKKTNDTFSPKLLKQTFNSFILNLKAQYERDDEYTKYYVYVRRNNNIVRKEYGKVGSGECVLDGTLDIKSFIEYIEPKYGELCCERFLQSILERKPWYNDVESLCRSEYEWIHWNELLDISKQLISPEKMSDFKMDLALLYLKRLNKKKN